MFNKIFMSIKENAISFLTLAGSGHIHKAFEKFTAAGCIHHNQYFNGDRASLIKAMEEDHESNPNKSIDVKHTYVDEQTVVTHSLVVKQLIEIAVVHIFRFEKEKIVELWDLGQIVEKDSPNENGLF